jgi:hypothetical protein
VKARSRQQAFAGFIAKTYIEVAALGTTWRNAHTKSIVPANHSIEELLPLHILIVAARQRGKVPEHEPGQLTPVCQPKILP